MVRSATEPDTIVVAAAENDHWNKYIAISFCVEIPFIAKLPLPMNEFIPVPSLGLPKAKP